MNNWHTLDLTKILDHLHTDATNGLDEQAVVQRQTEYGRNELIEQRARNPWQIVGEQLRATMVIILIVAALLSAALGDYQDTIAILVIVVLNAILGFMQEYRAERAMAALKQLAVPNARVRRGGHVQEVSARELVPGDIVLIEAGNRVPADGRVLESANLRIQEAALTGESEPVDKTPHVLAPADSSLGDRHNMAYMGTVVTYGRGQLIITATGMATELGAIATLMQTMEQTATPLQRRLDKLSRSLAAVALAIVGVIFAIGWLRGEALKPLFLTAVSMAVAAVPEGLPAIVTIVLALGAQRMLKRHALIRKLAAVETLGSITVICSDKTGTLTQNCMTATMLDIAGQCLDLTDNVSAIPLAATSVNGRMNTSGDSGLALLLIGGALCNDALIEGNDASPSSRRIVGDPTEGALLVAATNLGLDKADLDANFPRIAELPFDATRKRMTTIHVIPEASMVAHYALAIPYPNPASATDHAAYIAFTKGAVDSLLDVSGTVWNNGQIEPLNPTWRARIVAANDRLAQNGMRVLGIAFQPLHTSITPENFDFLERELIFIGLVGMIDPARPKVREAIATCISAGIRPVMITGDHPLTAQAVARELGIATNGRVLIGPELERMSLAELQAQVDQVAVYARVSPEHKLKIVQALQKGGQIVAMTGDGVNDAPALKMADIGVAMGITGTDVTKEAANMVLQDDNFATIVAAVEEGRVIYDNIRKFIKFLMTTNCGELWVMLLAPFLGMPLPLLPLQILWMNLVTDGLPALTLGVEPAERNIMRRPPYAPNESIFNRGLGWHILWVGLLIGFITLGVGYGYWHAGLASWQTMVFLTLTLTQMAHVLAIRSEQDSLFRIGLLSNKPLLGAVILTFSLQVAVIYLPFLQNVFGTVTLSASDLALSLALSSIVFCAVELEKWLKYLKATQVVTV